MTPLEQEIEKAARSEALAELKDALVNAARDLQPTFDKVFGADRIELWDFVTEMLRNKVVNNWGIVVERHGIPQGLVTHWAAKISAVLTETARETLARREGRME